MYTIRRSILVLLICSILLESTGKALQSVREECKLSAATFLKKTYDSLVEEMRRGVPHSLAATLFSHVQKDIFESKMDSKSASLAELCVPESQKDSLVNSNYTPLALQTAINKVKIVSGGRKPPYMPRESYSSQSLSALSEDVQNTVENDWVLTNELLNEKEQMNYSGDPFVFPSSWDLMDNTKRSESCLEFHRFSSEDSLTARELTIQMIALVVRLKLNGAPEDEAIQMLYHHAAYTFDGMRCLRKESQELYIPLAFSGIYQKAAAWISKDYASTYGPVASGIIEDVYPEVIEAIAAYNSWGTRGTFLVVNDVIEYQSWKSVLFNEASLEKVREGLAGEVVRTTWSAFALNNWYRSSSLCTSGWRWEDSTELSGTGIERCCSDLCYDGALAQSTLEFSIANCCEFCNQAYCNGDDEDFEDYVAVVPAFGDMVSYSTAIVI